MNHIKVKIEDLTHDPSNVRLHSEKNLDAIKASLLKFGQQKPIVVDTNMIVVAGNGTLAAAKKLGWSHLFAVVTELGSSDKTAYSIADNRTAELAEWDDESLANQLTALAEEDQDLLEAAGYSADELQQIVDLSIGGNDLDSKAKPTEVDVDGFNMANKCPACGFEFDKHV